MEQHKPLSRTTYQHCKRTPAWVSGSSSFEPLLTDQPPQSLPLPEHSRSSRKGAGRTEPITIYPDESWKLQAFLGALAVVWICTEMVCGTWSPSEEGNTVCSRGMRAQNRSLSQPTHLWARPEESYLPFTLPSFMIEFSSRRLFSLLRAELDQQLDPWLED